MSLHRGPMGVLCMLKAAGELEQTADGIRQSRSPTRDNPVLRCSPPSCIDGNVPLCHPDCRSTRYWSIASCKPAPGSCYALGD